MPAGKFLHHATLIMPLCSVLCLSVCRNCSATPGSQAEAQALLKRLFWAASPALAAAFPSCSAPMKKAWPPGSQDLAAFCFAASSFAASLATYAAALCGFQAEQPLPASLHFGQP